MNGIIAAKLISSLKSETTYWRFLLKINIDKISLINSLSNRDFYELVLGMVEDKDYSCERVSKVLFKVTSILFDYEGSETFLEEVYNYTLKKSFEKAVEMDINNNFMPVYELYLKFLDIVNEYQKKSGDETFMNIYPFELLTEEDINKLKDPEEYIVFKKAFKKQKIYEMMKLNHEVTKHSTIEHILGVHYLAMKIARQLEGILPVDLGRVSAAAAAHDIGKFGCRKDEVKKVAYYHYYYTNEWFENLNIKYLKNIAVYHSTWDLEYESLSLESLILIYSDFCVKRSRTKDGLFQMKFLTVAESFDVILSKLDNLNEEKINRYKRVYEKLKNFVEYLLKLDIDITVANYTGKEINATKQEITSVQDKYTNCYSLNRGIDIIKNLKFICIDKSVRLMHLLRNQSSLNDIILKASSVDDTHELRRYIFVFEEYSTYFTEEQKLMTIKFLESYLIHPEEDIRKNCAMLIGKLIALYDENYTKELPESANDSYKTETKIKVIKNLFLDFLKCDLRIIPSKRERQVTSYYELLKAIFEFEQVVVEKMIVKEIITLLNDNELDKYSTLFFLQGFEVFPMEILEKNQIYKIIKFLYNHVTHESEEIRITSLVTLIGYYNNHEINEQKYEEEFLLYLEKNDFQMAEGRLCEKLALKINSKFKGVNSIETSYSNIFLSNLKSETSKLKKISQLELLYKRSNDSDNVEQFYTAMHFCNVLKVSAYEPVRNVAGKYLLNIFENLCSEQKNDIIVELLRALEIDGYGFAKYIPEFLGILIIKVADVEYEEIIKDIKFKIVNASVYLKMLLINTVGISIAGLLEESEVDANKISILVGYIFKGFLSDDLTSQIAFNVIAKDLLGNNEISLEARFKLFELVYKKINIYIMDLEKLQKFDTLKFSVGLNYIYKFISDYLYYIGEMNFKIIEKVAFYNGTFDPFSLGQKRAATDARDLGMEVFIGINEFQWKKRTQPSLMRREIVKMSIADLSDIYTFPSEIPINLWNENDLLKLKEIFKDRNLYLIAGEETLLYDGLYTKPNSMIYNFSHIVYLRDSIKHSEESSKNIRERINNIKGDVIIRTLEFKYEMIDAELIRTNMDKNWDGHGIVDDMAIKYIYDNRLYRNEPMYKSNVTTNDLVVEVKPLKYIKDLSEVITINPTSLNEIKRYKLNHNLLTIKDTDNIIASSIFSIIDCTDINCDLKNMHGSKVILIDYIDKESRKKIHSLDQIILTETLMFGVKENCDYAVVRTTMKSELTNELTNLLIRSGFTEHIEMEKRKYIANIKSPIVLNLDGTTRMKLQFRKNDEIRNAIKLARVHLQAAIAKLYKGNVVLSFDRSMLYSRLINEITKTNNVPANEKVACGEFLCVPYGDIFKRWILPNTVTKAFHTERYYSKELIKYSVKPYPGYLDISSQLNVLKSFDRPLMLVDDLFDKGSRLNALSEYFDNVDIKIEQVVVGILSKRGFDLLASKTIKATSAYYIPEIKFWFNESDLYPFIGGDSVDGIIEKNFLVSTNLILPFTYPKYLKNVSNEDVYDFSMVCLENALNILTEVEKVYLSIYKRNLSIKNLKEVMVTPRAIDVGKNVKHNQNLKPTDYLKDEIERLKRIRPLFKN